MRSGLFHRTGLALLALLASGMVPLRSAHAAEMTGQEAMEAVSKAFDERKSGNLEGVIPLLDPVIAAYKGMQAQMPSFCAENSGQSLLILGAAATSGAGRSGKAARVVEESFCIALFLKGFVLIDLGRAEEAEGFLRRARGRTLQRALPQRICRVVQDDGQVAARA